MSSGLIGMSSGLIGMSSGLKVTFLHASAFPIATCGCESYGR